ncbi:MAG TPA: hypothetical protein VF074_17575, partial [Pyrinomonadaceae bacterium]
MRFSARRNYQAVVVFLTLLLLPAISCRRASNLPQKSSNEYNDAIKTFYIGLAALQVGDDIRADEKLAHF